MLGQKVGGHGPHQAEVDEVHPLHLQRSEVVFDAGPQLGGRLRGQPAAPVVAATADLGDELEVVRVGVQCLADQVVDDVGPVVLGGVDVVDAELDRAAQHGPGGVWIAGRAEHAGSGELHGAEADAVDGLVAEERRLVHANPVVVIVIASEVTRWVAPTMLGRQGWPRASDFELAMDVQVVLVADVHGRAGLTTELRALLVELADASRGEPGCVEFRVLAGADPGEFVLLSVWRDEDALRTHYDSSHYAHYRAHVGPLLSRPSDVVVYRVSSVVHARDPNPPEPGLFGSTRRSESQRASVETGNRPGARCSPSPPTLFGNRFDVAQRPRLGYHARSVGGRSRVRGQDRVHLQEAQQALASSSA